MSTPSKPDISEEPLRPHSYDGIQEFDKRLPNWWLFTLYGAIVFAIVYWMYYQTSKVGMSQRDVFEVRMQAVQEARLANSLGKLDDAELWKMSRDPKFVDAGKAAFQTNCVACHLASMKGKSENPTAIGPNLIDDEWIHGGTPSQVRTTITNGVLEKGMPSWGPVLGDRTIVDLVAYVMSHHPAPAAESAPSP